MRFVEFSHITFAFPVTQFKAIRFSRDIILGNAPRVHSGAWRRPWNAYWPRAVHGPLVGRPAPGTAQLPAFPSKSSKKLKSKIFLRESNKILKQLGSWTVCFHTMIWLYDMRTVIASDKTQTMTSLLFDSGKQRQKKRTLCRSSNKSSQAFN